MGFQNALSCSVARPYPWPIRRSYTHYWEGGKLYLCTRMMDDKLNLCPGTEGEWWQRYLSWEWRLGSAEAGCLKAQDIDKFIQWTPLLGPFLCFEFWPLTKWPTSLMLPVCEECPAMPGILPLLMLVVHSFVRPKSLTHVEPCLFVVWFWVTGLIWFFKLTESFRNNLNDFFFLSFFSLV